MFETENSTSNKRRYFWMLVVLILLLIAGFSLYPYIKNRFLTKKDNQIERKTIPTSELPSKFPADTPLTKAAVVVHNFEANLPDGTTQSVRKWQSVEAPTQVRASYVNYFAQNGWEVTTSVSQPGLELVAARKDELFMSVSIHTAPDGNGSLIEVAVK